MSKAFRKRVQVRATCTGHGKVFIDGEELDGVRAVSVRVGAGELATVTVELNVTDVDLQIADKP